MTKGSINMDAVTIINMYTYNNRIGQRKVDRENIPQTYL